MTGKKTEVACVKLSDDIKTRNQLSEEQKQSLSQDPPKQEPEEEKEESGSLN